MRIDIPGRESLEIEHVVLDFNGTIAVDGHIIEALRDRLHALAELTDVHVLTADTYGTVCAQCAPYGVQVDVFPTGDAAPCKRDIVAGLQGGVCCFGNGYNDRLMFEQASLAVAIMEREGACAALIGCADVVVAHAEDAFDLLLCPNRLIATLRG